MSANTASTTNTLALLDHLKTEMPENIDLVVEDVRAAKTREVKKTTANGQQDSEVLNENRVSELTVDTSIESPFRISHHPKSRFWAVYDGDALVAVTVYRRGAEEVRRRLQAAADLER
jgi:hypothetical protein